MGIVRMVHVPMTGCLGTLHSGPPNRVGCHNRPTGGHNTQMQQG